MNSLPKVGMIFIALVFIFISLRADAQQTSIDHCSSYKAHLGLDFADLSGSSSKDEENIPGHATVYIRIDCDGPACGKSWPYFRAVETSLKMWGYVDLDYSENLFDDVKNNSETKLKLWGFGATLGNIEISEVPSLDHFFLEDLSFSGGGLNLPGTSTFYFQTQLPSDPMVWSPTGKKGKATLVKLDPLNSGSNQITVTGKGYIFYEGQKRQLNLPPSVPTEIPYFVGIFKEVSGIDFPADLKAPQFRFLALSTITNPFIYTTSKLGNTLTIKVWVHLQGNLFGTCISYKPLNPSLIPYCEVPSYPPEKKAACPPPSPPPPVCGNRIVEKGEQCDPPDGSTCDTACRKITPPPDDSPVCKEKPWLEMCN